MFFLAKFTENDHEKVDRLMELHDKYFRYVRDLYNFSFWEGRPVKMKVPNNITFNRDALSIIVNILFACLLLGICYWFADLFLKNS